VAGRTASSRASDGTDTLTNVEYLRFANGTLNVSRLREADREAAGPLAHSSTVFLGGGNQLVVSGITDLSLKDFLLA
jgi:hypothetical protein